MAESAKLTLQDLMSSAMKVLTEKPLFTVGEAEVRGQNYRVFTNTPQTVPAMFDAAAKEYPDDDFLAFRKTRLTRKELWSRSCRFARALRETCGVKKGDLVALAMRNYPEWCIAYMGAITAGAVVVPLNAWWRSDELKYALADCQAKIVIADDKRYEFISPFREELGLTMITACAEIDGTDYTLEELVADASGDTMPKVSIDPDDDYCIVYTSGSTGQPKGVILTHRGCISAIYSWAFIVNVLSDAAGAPVWGDNPGILLNVPLFHVTGSHSVFLLSLVCGRRVHMMYRWDPKEAVEIIRRESLSNFVGVPSQSFELIDAAGDEGLPSLKDIGAGGAKRPAEHVRKLDSHFDQARPSSGYGLSETNALACVISQDFYADRPDSTGRPVPPLTDIKIMTDDGEAQRGEVGEIWIRSPANFRGYFNRPEDTQDALTADGWFKTGDLGRMDEEDFVYIVDRIKELIIRGGENISSLEVENIVYEHPAVSEAAVISVPCDLLGERVGLVVRAKDGNKIDPVQLREFMSERLAAFKTPERIWISPMALPRLGTAKLDKVTIRKAALNQPPTLTV